MGTHKQTSPAAARPQDTARRWWAAAVIVATVVTGCGRSTGRIEDGRRFLDAGDIASATIELKNVLQAHPNSGEARLLLGKALLAGGDALGAEAELRRALEARHPAEDVLPELARVLVALQRFAQLIKEFGTTELNTDGAAADFKTQLAAALMATGALDEAHKALAAALQRVPGHREATEVKARLLAARGDPAGATALADSIVARFGNDASAWVFKGDVLAQISPASADAAAAYRKALSLDAKHVQAHGGLLTLLTVARDFAAAEVQFKLMQAAQPRHALTYYHEALLSLQRGEAARASELAQALLRRAPDNPRLNMLLGQAELAAGALLQAETHLQKALTLSSDAPQPRRVLANAYLQMGQPAKAINTLAPLIGQRSEDAEALTIAGRAHLMAGDHGMAAARFDRAVQLAPADPAVRAGVALARISRGEADAGLAALEAVVRSDPSASADLTLINARMQRKQWPQALDAVVVYARKVPTSPQPDLLRGRIAMAQGDRAGARAAWEAALKKANFPPALLALVELDITEGKSDAARARLAEALKREPNHGALLLAQADVIGRTGGSKKEVVSLLQKAARATPSDALVRVNLVDYAIAMGDHGLALSEAQAAHAALPEDQRVLERLGLAQQLSGDLQQAAGTFGKLAAAQPRAAGPLLRLTEINLALNRHDAAVANSRRALELEPASFVTLRAAALTLQRAGRGDELAPLLRTAQTRWPAAGLELEGDLSQMQGQREAAITAYRKALAVQPGAELARKLHAALLQAGKTADAERHAQAWVQAHPADSAFLVHLGLLAVSQSDLPRAEQRFRQILDKQPNHLEALNNLAYVLAMQNKPGAVEAAERAVRLAPNRGALMDTLAFAHARGGQLPRALEIQKQVVEMSPDVPLFRLSLARLQVQSGEKEPARENLNRLAKIGKAFAQHQEVAELLLQIGS